MKRIRDGVAMPDVHRDTVVACCRVPGTRHGFKTIKRFIATTSTELAELGQWLLEAGVTTVVMQAPRSTGRRRTTPSTAPLRSCGCATRNT